MNRSTIKSLALLVLAIIVVHGPSVRFGFLDWDDQNLIAQNPNLQNITTAGLANFWTSPQNKLYSPLTYTVWAGLSALGHPMNPHLFHAANVIVHALATVFAWRILLLLVKQESAALLGALAFALHPLQVEAVAWATSLNTLLCGMCGLASVWAYLKFLDAADRRAKIVFAIAASIAFAAALLAKPLGVVVPLIAICLKRDRRAMGLVLVWLVVAIVFSVIARRAQPAVEIEKPSLSTRVIVASDASAFYVAKFVLPYPLAPDYGRTPQWLMRSSQVAWTWLVPAALLIICWRSHSTALANGCLVFVAGLIPVLGLTPFQFQEFSTTADRYAYLAMLGPAMLIAQLIARRVKWMPIAIIVICAWTGLSIRQVQLWRDDASLFEHNLRVNPQSIASRRVLAVYASQHGDKGKAIQLYADILRMHPNDAEASFGIANALRETRPDSALEYYEAAIRARPDNPKFYNNYAIALLMLNRDRDAEVALEAALKISPSYADAQKNLAILRHKRQTTQPQ